MRRRRTSPSAGEEERAAATEVRTTAASRQFQPLAKKGRKACAQKLRRSSGGRGEGGG
jgi:hypothetical protein